MFLSSLFVPFAWICNSICLHDSRKFIIQYNIFWKLCRFSQYQNNIYDFQCFLFCSKCHEIRKYLRKCDLRSQYFFLFMSSTWDDLRGKLLSCKKYQISYRISHIETLTFAIDKVGATKECYFSFFSSVVV